MGLIAEAAQRDHSGGVSGGDSGHETDHAQTHGRGDWERGIGCTAGIRSCARQVGLFMIW